MRHEARGGRRESSRLKAERDKGKRRSAFGVRRKRYQEYGHEGEARKSSEL